jgi:hypothetical protein
MKLSHPTQQGLCMENVVNDLQTMHWGSTDGPEEKDMNAMIPQIEGRRLNTEIYNMFL